MAGARPHVVPPPHVRGLPVFQCALQDAVAAQVDVVRYPVSVVDGAGHVRGAPFPQLRAIDVSLCPNLNDRSRILWPTGDGRQPGEF